MSAFAFIGVDIFDGTGVRRDHAVIIRDGRVADLLPAAQLGSDMATERLAGHMLVPGFIDVQVNGGGGVLLNDAPNVAGIGRICDAHALFGTTSLLPTLITDTPALTATVVAAVKQALAANLPGCLGLHLEGPFLSPERRGAHDAQLIRQMNDADVDLLLGLGLQTLLVTLSPERVQPRIIRRLADAGIVVSLGHSNASYDQVLAAVDAGARGVTHLFNAMSPLTHRAPGVVGAALDSGQLWCGLIADGHHVHKAAIDIALRAKRGPGRIFLVTDAMSTVGSDIQSFDLNGRRITRQDGVLVLDDGTLAGSDLDMMAAVRFMVQGVGLDLLQALRMASVDPADFLGRQDIGRIAAGARADFVLIDHDLRAKAVWRGGVRR
ncbi:N-acetylglucosamine-6-phosphate deacetylase [Dongia rigui]|uniref:N-acetylglucosamine-6-phosphate deacetylase n=1 Tax=Dongia rigui TaxID=940149 RepID=A0ABU5DZH1_9PROT|nr:N-acetylglucosamine-6-phosphate deacetylase [Dongia rigui]MDY0872680.1 N-acetylglucosamine-6-phosphate deacetylase [Dongia rigui]